MRFLVLCRPAPGVDAAAEIPPRGAEEMRALRALRGEGLLLEAYSPGEPGAVLIFDCEREALDDALARLPLLRERIVTAEVIELHRFAGLGG